MDAVERTMYADAMPDELTAKVTRAGAPTVGDLLELLRLLDMGADAGSDHDEAGIEYIDITRWNQEGKGAGGNDDPRSREILRLLVRERIGTFPVEQVGAAVLVELDQGKAASRPLLDHREPGRASL